LLLVFDRDDIMFVFGGLMYVFDLFASVNGGLVGLHLLTALFGILGYQKLMWCLVTGHHCYKGYDREA
jgi:hypothetical protein